MDKKWLIVCIVSLLAAAMVTAAGSVGAQAGSQEPGSPEPKNAGEGVQTANEGEDSEIQQEVNNPMTGDQIQEQVQTTAQDMMGVKQQAKSGTLTTEGGDQVKIQEQANNKVMFQAGETQAQTSMMMTQEQTEQGTKLHVKLSNGKDAEIKIMPDTASERAIERLGLKVCSAENGCQIELKEVGSGEEIKAAYEIKTQKESRVLGIFKAKMQVEAQVDAENGEIIKAKKPWWAFLASEPEA